MRKVEHIAVVVNLASQQGVPRVFWEFLTWGSQVKNRRRRGSMNKVNITKWIREATEAVITEFLSWIYYK